MLSSDGRHSSKRLGHVFNIAAAKMIHAAIAVCRYNEIGGDMIALELPTEIESRLEAQAKLSGRSIADYAYDVLLEHISDREAYYRAVSRKDEKTYPLEEVMRELGFENLDA
jgi:predicted DNA-binding protein